MISGLPYAPRWCEENVWQLCQQPAPLGQDLYVLFVSNARRACAIWQQRAAKDPQLPVIWDYHVLAVASGDPPQAWDPDCRLGLPLPLEIYLRESFLPLRAAYAHLAPHFRLLPSRTYLREFSSDRSHMRAADGGWLAPPPPWPLIGAPAVPSNLLRFIDMDDPFMGQRLDLDGLRARFLST